MVFLREAPKTLKRKSEVALKGGTPNAMAVMRRDLNIVLVFVAFMLAQFGFTTFQTLFVLYVTSNKHTHGKYNFTEQKIGMVFALFGVAMIVTQMIATAPLSRFLGDKWATISGSFLRGIGLSALPFVDLNTGTPVHENWMIACVMAIAVSGSLVNPCLSAIVANFSDRRTQGTILGINQMFGAFARAAAPIIAAAVYTWDQTSAWTYFGGVSCALCCIVMLPLRVPVITDTKSRITSLVNAAAAIEDPETGKEIYAYGEGAVARGDDHVEGYDFETDTEDNVNSMQDFTHEKRYDPHSPPSENVE
jgi:MFS family permease